MNGFYWIYLVMLLFAVGYFHTESPERRRLIYYGFAGFLIVIFTVQDYSVSVDIAEYMRQYAIIPNLTFVEMLGHKFEIGFVLLCWLVERFFDSDRVLLLVVGVLIVLPFARMYEKETDNPMVGLAAFVALGMFMHGLIYWRQLIAMGILAMGYSYIRQRRPVPFLLTVLAAMAFHKTAVVFLGLYLIYRIPINKWLLMVCAGIALILGLFGNQIIDLGIALIYPQYAAFPRLSIGGYTLLALLWVVVLLSYWVFHERLEEDRVRLPFLMILIGATIQPVCFAFYNWLRIVLYFRVALAAMSAMLFCGLFEQRLNPVAGLIQRVSPGLYRRTMWAYDQKWFRTAMMLLLFAVLFVWYVSELDGGIYVMAPVVPQTIAGG